MIGTILQGTIFSIPEGLNASDYHNYCRDWIKPYLHVVYQHSDFKFFFYISGIVFEYLQKNSKECVDVLHEISARSQIELLNGMYYDAAPALQPRQDQREQLERLSHYMRNHNFDVMPSKGAWVMSGTYEHNIIMSLYEHGARYLLIDRAYLEPVPSIHELGLVETLGTKLVVLPYEELYPAHLVDDDFIQNLCDTLQQKNSKKVVVMVSKYSSVVDSKLYFKNFDKMLHTLKQKKLENASKLPSKCANFDLYSKQICRIRSAPYGIVDYNSFFNFILSRFESRILYSYFLYIMKQISLYKNQDKDRKQSARMAIRHLQNHFVFWKYNDDWGIHNNKLRQHMYQSLCLIEKSLKKQTINTNKKTNNIVFSSVDYDMNGDKEFFISSQNSTIVLEKKHASIIMLLRKNKRWNYLSCYDPYDKPKNFPSSFREIILSQDGDIKEAHSNILSNNSQYSPVKYSDQFFNATHSSIIYYSSEKSPLQVEKQYLFSGNNNMLDIVYRFSHIGNSINLEDTLDIMLIIEMNFSFASSDCSCLEIMVDGNQISTKDMCQTEGKNLVMLNHVNKEKLMIDLANKVGMSFAPVCGVGDIEVNNMYQHHSILFYIPYNMGVNSYETCEIHLGFSNITQLKKLLFLSNKETI